MGSQSNNDFDNVNLSIKSSSSKYNVQNRRNRGRAVEKYHQTCGKNEQKSGKLNEKSGKLDYSGTFIKRISPSMAEERADALIAYFNAPHCREFFLKCIYHLPDDDIYKAMQNAVRPYIKSPVKYFNKTCKLLMIKYNS